MHKDITDDVRAIAHGIEEGVNTIKEPNGQTQVKAAYKRYSFDFYKTDGYSEKIQLILPPKSQ